MLENQDGESSFYKIWVSKNGLVDKEPDLDNRFSERECEIMADCLMQFLQPYIG